MDGRNFVFEDVTSSRLNAIAAEATNAQSFCTAAAASQGSFGFGPLVSNPELLSLVIQQQQNQQRPMDSAHKTLPLTLAAWDQAENIAPTLPLPTAVPNSLGQLGQKIGDFAPISPALTPTVPDVVSGLPSIGQGYAVSNIGADVAPGVGSASMEILSMSSAAAGVQPIGSLLGTPSQAFNLGSVFSGDLSQPFEQGGLFDAQVSVAVHRPVQMSGQAPLCPKWIIPSGPRRQGEGVQEATQNILCVYKAGGSLCVGVTLLVSGFIIGAGGSSIRGIQSKTNTKIKSWNQHVGGELGSKTIRIFSIEGSDESQAAALDFLKAAVKHYKYLAEGACCGRQVDQNQEINGVLFSYSPPPKSAVPHAAGIKPETCTPRFDKDAMATLLSMLGC